MINALAVLCIKCTQLFPVPSWSILWSVSGPHSCHHGLQHIHLYLGHGGADSTQQE